MTSSCTDPPPGTSSSTSTNYRPPTPHMQFATAHRELLGGTSAGKAAHLRDLGRRRRTPHRPRHGRGGRRHRSGLARRRHPDRSHLRGRPERTPPEPHGPRRRAGLHLPRRADARRTPSWRMSRAVGCWTPPRKHAQWSSTCPSPRATPSNMSPLSGFRSGPTCTTTTEAARFHAPFLDAASFVFMNGDRLDAPTTSWTRA